jgi:hypothetical protein
LIVPDSSRKGYIALVTPRRTFASIQPTTGDVRRRLREAFETNR